MRRTLPVVAVLGSVYAACAPAPVSPRPSRDASRVFLGDRIVDLDTGAVLPTVHVRPGDVDSPWVSDRSMVYATGSDKLYAIRLSDGKLLWQVPDGGDTVSQTRTTIVSTWPRARVYDKATGRRLMVRLLAWTAPLDGDRIATVWFGSKLQVRDARSGRVLSQVPVLRPYGDAYMYPPMGVSPDGKLFCLCVVAPKSAPTVECWNSRLRVLSRAPLPPPAVDPGLPDWKDYSQIHSVGRDFVVVGPAPFGMSSQAPLSTVPLWVVQVPGGKILIKVCGSDLSPVLGADGKLQAVLVLNPRTSKLSLYDASSGLRRWSIPAAWGDRVTSINVGGRIVATTYGFHGSGAGVVREIDPTDGRVFWTSEPPPYTTIINTPAGYGNRVSLRFRRNTIVATCIETGASYIDVLDARTGRLLRKYMPRGWRPSPPGVR